MNDKKRKRCFHLLPNEHSTRFCIVLTAIILLISFCVSFVSGKYMSEVSCTVGLCSLLFSAWLAHRAISIREHVMSKSVFNSICRLYDDWNKQPWSGLSNITDEKREEALQIYDFALKTAPSIPDEIRRLINTARNQLQSDIAEGKPTLTNTFINQLRAIVDTNNNI